MRLVTTSGRTSAILVTTHVGFGLGFPSHAASHGALRPPATTSFVHRVRGRPAHQGPQETDTMSFGYRRDRSAVDLLYAPLVLCSSAASAAAGTQPWYDPAGGVCR